MSKMKRVKKFCHIHDTPEGQVLFEVKQSEDDENEYFIQAKLQYDECNIAAQISGGFTMKEALKVLDTMNYQECTNMVIESINESGITT